MFMHRKIREIRAKTMLHYHKQTFSTNWDANIYRGCEHNCRYCFAQYSHRYLAVASPRKNKRGGFTFLQEYFPELVADYKLLYQTANVSDKYRIKLKMKIKNLRDKYQLHSEHKPTTSKHRVWTQQTLFN